LAASSISLLTLPQTDSPNDDDNLPQGEERSEQFVLEVSEYFERLDVCVVSPSKKRNFKNFELIYLFFLYI
jgi:hypothetical protein